MDPVTTAARVDKIDPETLQFTDEDFALLDTPLLPFSIITLLWAFGPICCTYPHEEWLVHPNFTQSLDKTQWKSHPV